MALLAPFMASPIAWLDLSVWIRSETAWSWVRRVRTRSLAMILQAFWRSEIARQLVMARP
jgi:hypothetical protein